MLCAVGSQDATLSIWMTAQSRPVAIIRNLFEAEISDLTWNSTGEGPLGGRVLFACSLEGSIACLQFEAVNSEKFYLHQRQKSAFATFMAFLPLLQITYS